MVATGVGGPNKRCLLPSVLAAVVAVVIMVVVVVVVVGLCGRSGVASTITARSNYLIRSYTKNIKV